MITDDRAVRRPLNPFQRGQPVTRTTHGYCALLTKASDIGGNLTTPQPPVLNPNTAPEVAPSCASAGNSRRIGDNILLVADHTKAAAGIENTKANYGSKVTGTWQPVDVGSNGATISGTSPDNSLSTALLAAHAG